MKFLEKITVPRAGRDEEDFVLHLTDDEARNQLRGQKVPHTLVEYLSCSDGDPYLAAHGKFYLDRDVWLGPEPPSEELLAFHRKEVVDNVRILVETLTKNRDFEITVKIATRHGFCNGRHLHKASFRPFLLGISIRYTDIMRVIKMKKQENFWDPTVYKSSEQLLATINGCKGQIGGIYDTRVLTPECPTDDPLDYVVQHAPSHWPFLDLPPLAKGLVIGEAMTVEEDKHDMLSPEFDANLIEHPAFIRDLLACLSKTTSDNRDSWIKIGYILRGLEREGAGLGNDYWEDFLRFSKLGTGKFDGERKCRKAWDSFRIGSRAAGSSGSITIASLVQYAKLDDPAAYEIARRANNKRRRDQAESLIVSRYMFRDEGDHIPFPRGENERALARTRAMPMTRAMFDQGASASSSGCAWTGADTDIDADADTDTESVIDDIDHLGPLRAALVKLHPAFHNITRAGFSSTPLADGSTIMFLDPTLTDEVIMVLPTSVRIAGVIVGEIAPDLKINGMDRFLVQIPEVTRFTVSCDQHGNDMTLTNCEDSLSQLKLYDINKKPSGKVGLGRGPPKAMTGKHAKAIVDSVKSQVFTHVDKSLGTPGGTTRNYFTINFNQTINNVLVVQQAGRGACGQAQIAGGGEPQKPSDFEVTRLKLQAAGLRDRLKKLDGIVYEPVKDCPCAYVERCTYHEFISFELKGDTVFFSNPRRFEELMKFMTNYLHVEEIPTLKLDRDLLSFSNGVLELSTGVFTAYNTEGIELDEGLALKVARHHIPYPYTGREDTPLFDTILDAQFGRDVAQILCALLGRTFFKIGQHDMWQVMPFIVGVGGTGKSLVLKIVESWFSRGAVGNLSAKREEVFGMANLVDKELVMGRDMPAKMSASLPQDMMQSMTAGEGMEVPRKGLTALQVQWSAPVIMASNHMPDYVNTGNNIGRRMVSIRFDNTIKNPQEDLERRILEKELPNIVCRCLGSYHDLRGLVKTTPGGFWKCVPEQVLEWRGMLSAATNKVEEFLAKDCKERGVTIEFVEGAVTWEVDLKAAFVSAMGAGVPYVADAAIFAAHGFYTSAERVNMCLCCKKKGLAGCCPAWDPKKRGKKTLVFNMEMLPYEE